LEIARQIIPWRAISFVSWVQIRIISIRIMEFCFDSCQQSDKSQLKESINRNILPFLPPILWIIEKKIPKEK